MTDTPQRRRLLDGLGESLKAASALPEARIAEAAARHGFSEAIVAPEDAQISATIKVRRQRTSKGRTEQFNVRLRPDTLNDIYAEANDRNVPLAQVIEEAVALLRARK